MVAVSLKKPAKPQGNIKQSWKLDIDCPNCAAKVERALQKLPGVVSVSLNYVQKKITLEAPADRFEEVRKAAYEMVRCDWSSDVCSSDLKL